MMRRRYLLPMLLLALVLRAEAQAPVVGAPAPAPAAAAPRGIGPFSIETARGPLTVRLLRRDRDLVWIVQQLNSGQTVDTALPAKEITRFVLPRPRLFQALDVATKEQAKLLRPQLEAYIRQLMPYRDLPGLNVDEGQLLLGRLLELEEDWKGAAAVYADIMAQPYKPAESARAGLRRGTHCACVSASFVQTAATKWLTKRDLWLRPKITPAPPPARPGALQAQAQAVGVGPGWWREMVGPGSGAVAVARGPFKRLFLAISCQIGL